MLTSLVAELETGSAFTVPTTHGEAMQSELLRQLQGLSATLTTQLHGEADDQPRPYTISPLYPDRPRVKNGMLYFQPGDRCWFRLTGLRADASQLLLAFSETARYWRIQGNSFGGEFAILRWFNVPGEHPWAGIISLEDLGEAAWRAYEQEAGSHPASIPHPDHLRGCLRIRLGELDAPSRPEAGVRKPAKASGRSVPGTG